MGTALRQPNQILPLVCESASVLDGAVLVMGSADDKVALPAGADTTLPVIGLAHVPPSSTSGVTLDVVVSGVYAGIASAAITRGALVTVAGTTGKVKALGLTSGAGATIVGMAMESVSADGDRVAILLLPQARPSVVMPFTAGTGGTTANAIVVVGSASGQVVLPGGADPTKGVIGIALTTVLATEAAKVIVSGPALLVAGSNISIGENVAVHGVTGYGKNAAPSAGTNSMCVGTALEAITAAGSVPGLVLVNPFMFQG